MISSLYFSFTVFDLKIQSRMMMMTRMIFKTSHSRVMLTKLYSLLLVLFMGSLSLHFSVHLFSSFRYFYFETIQFFIFGQKKLLNMNMYRQEYRAIDEEAQHVLSYFDTKSRSCVILPYSIQVRLNTYIIPL